MMDMTEQVEQIIEREPGQLGEQTGEQPTPKAETAQVSEQPKKKRRQYNDPFRAVAKQIAGTLNEPQYQLVYRTVKAVGPERALAFLEEVQGVETAGGMLTSDGSRRRSPGGVFFYLVRGKVSPEERKIIWPWWKGTGQPGESRPPRPARPAPPLTPELPPVAWADRASLVEEALKQKGEVQTVKMTLIGRPGKVVEQGQTVVTTMKTTGKAPAMPKGVPVPPDLPMTYVVYIAVKQWRKVVDFLKNPDDVLIVEGFPTFDPELKKMTLLALSVVTKHQQQAKRKNQGEGGEPEAKR
jgi:hypothetical protein